MSGWEDGIGAPNKRVDGKYWTLWSDNAENPELKIDAESYSVTVLEMRI